MSDLQQCGHPVSEIVSSGTGPITTNYCAACQREAVAHEQKCNLKPCEACGSPTCEPVHVHGHTQGSICRQVVTACCGQYD